DRAPRRAPLPPPSPLPQGDRVIDLPPDLQRHVAGEAARAPSVNTVRPARWRFLPGGEVRLLRDVRRALPVADPTGHDVLVSLGAAFEGLRLALSRRGLGLSEPEPCEGFEEPFAPVARAWILEAGAADPLAEELLRRRTYRGRFRPATAQEAPGLLPRVPAAGAPAAARASRRAAARRRAAAFCAPPPIRRSSTAGCASGGEPPATGATD